MKALSLKQPWAELVVSGRKTMEIRSWNTKFRGWFLVHASKIPDRETMEEFGFSELPLGVIVGEAELVDVKKYDVKSFDGDKGKHLATSDWGNYGFVLKNAKRVKLVEYKENFEKVGKSKFSKKNFAQISFGNNTYAKFSKGMLGFWEFG